MSSGAQAAVHVGMPVLMVVPLLSLFHLDGQQGFPFHPPRPSPGAEGQQGSIAVHAVYMVHLHFSQWLPWTCFVSAIILGCKLDDEVHQQ